MARDFFINGESLVYVKGNTSTLIPSLTQLGLADSPIRIHLEFRHKDIKVDAWGDAPPEIQFMLGWATIDMTLVHFDRAVLDEILQESMAGAPAVGQVPRAGSRMGNNLPRFGSVGPGVNQSNHYIGLNIASPVANKPWRFWNTYLTQPPMIFPLGTEKSLCQLNFRAVPYSPDPANIVGGIILGASGQTIWDYTLDS